ncbi:MAG: beta-glucosidase BglX [Prolixibacteraceae bacterium]
MKNILILLTAFICISSCNTSQSKSEMDQFIDGLIGKMTIEEKVGQLNLIPYEGNTPEELKDIIAAGKVGAILKSNGAAQNRIIQEMAVKESRLGIPIMFQEDVIHGYRTIAPVPLAEAASWDLKLIQQSAAIAAQEAAAAGIHLTYAPMVDICRDPRWGRILEAGGEDVFLGSKIAAARVKGFQGTDLASTSTVMACVKHFAGYGAILAGRDYNIQDFSDRELYETYLPPFQAAVDAGVGSVMCAYTSVNAIPATANKYLLHDILRNEMGFDGLLMTDWSTIPNLVKIGVAKNDTLATLMAINAGVDMDMTSEKYLELLPVLVKKGLVSEAEINNAVRKVLVAKYKVGLFSDPYAYFDIENENATLLSADNIEKTKLMAQKSMVLLKNDHQTLPLNATIKTLAVIGPFAKSKKDLMGWWACKGIENEVTSVYEGILSELSQKSKIIYAEGCIIDSFRISGTNLIPAAVKAAQMADAVVVVLGEEYWMSGEGGGTASIRLPGAQEQLLEALSKTGKPIVTVLINGRPYILDKVVENSQAVLEAWMPGTTGGNAVAEILFGKFNPGGKLPVTFPIHEGQIPIYYNYRQTSHPFYTGPDRYTNSYRDIQHEPLFPFGFGLSYTTYEYGKINLSNSKLAENDSIMVSIEVKNTGQLAGTEIVQLYLRDNVCSVTRPVKELKGFELLDLLPGQSKTASFTIKADMLKFIGADLKPSIEKGDFTLYIGASSANVQELSFSLE